MFTQVRVGMQFKKVALIGAGAWAHWNNNFFVRKNLRELGYDARIFNWESGSEVKKGLEWCDMFITEVSSFNSFPKEYRHKGMFCWRAVANIEEDPLSKSQRVKHFTTLIDVDKQFERNFFATTDHIADSVESYYGIRPRLMPSGADADYWEKREIRSIKKLGHVAAKNPSRSYTLVKRPDMFRQIADKADLDRITLNGRSMLCGTAMYRDADAIICTSTTEGHPMAVLECTMAKIPYISTNVGIVHEFPSIRTFETVEEAVAIIKDFNENPEKLKKYVDDVYNEVISKRNWSDIIDKYYVPVIEELTK